uniref:NADP-dependent oxidoreductase domain-containing protein n=1 Tax=Glycine max TaxID=3847 RepID=A0A368UGG3_SOYBN
MAQSVQMPRVKLGTQGLEVSKLGYGCMGLTGAYNDPLPEEEGISVIKHAFSKGITFFDTSDMYGPHANEIVLGKAIKQLPREKIQIATKFGITKIDSSGMVVKGTPEYARSCCEASLKRLGVEYIDLYYQHRVDLSVPIEETIGELKKLVEEGKVRYIGLSEASPDTIRRAHAVHPITAVQMEWSLWTRDIEDEIIPLCKELGIGIVPYSPLGRGFFGGKGVLETVSTVSSLITHPRFQAENLDKNKNFCIWSTGVKNLDQNIGALSLKLTESDLREISEAVPIDEVAGTRHYYGSASFSWTVANTPPKDPRV